MLKKDDNFLVTVYVFFSLFDEMFQDAFVSYSGKNKFYIWCSGVVAPNWLGRHQRFWRPLENCALNNPLVQLYLIRFLNTLCNDALKPDEEL